MANGKYQNKNGYILLYRPDYPRAQSNGCVLEHRIIYEEYYNCCLLYWVHIHHKNGKQWDNRIENLQPYSRPQHTSLENMGNKYGIGKVPWNKNMKMSEEYKKTLPDQSGENNFFYGKHHTDRVKRIVSQTHFGKPLSLEHRKKLSESHKTYYKNHKVWNKGKKMEKRHG